MNDSFDPQQGPVIVAVEVRGPSGTASLQVALDTGATTTLINSSILVALGYDTAAATERTEITTGSGVVFAARIRVEKISALGLEREGFPVLVHTLPPSAGVDGLLGLDFLRGRVLTIDFRNGLLRLNG